MSQRKDNKQYEKNIRQRPLDAIELQMVIDQHIEKNKLVDPAERFLASTEGGERERELMLREAIDAANAKRKAPKEKPIMELNPNWKPGRLEGGRFAHKWRKVVKEI